MKMNSLQNILHFMSKCVNFINSYLKEYLTKRSFIIMFWKAFEATRICNKKMEIFI